SSSGSLVKPLPQCRSANSEQTDLIDCAELQTTGNPYADIVMYLDPDYRRDLEAFEELNSEDSQMRAAIEVVKQQPTAIWLDTFDMLIIGDETTNRRSLLEHLEEATIQQNALSDNEYIPQMAIQIVVQLNPIPAPHGDQTELGYTEDDLEKYETAFIDELEELTEAYANLRFIIVLEPNTVPDLLMVSCLPEELFCQQRHADTGDLIRYATKTLGDTVDRNTYLYLGIGHS